MEWIESLKGNFSFSDVIAFLSMLGAIIAAIVAWRSKRKAAESETRAEQYAKNADEANKSAKQFFDAINGHLEKQNDSELKEEKKKKIRLNMFPTIKLTTDVIATKVGFSEEETDELLKELELDGKVINNKYLRGKDRWKLKE